MINNRVTKMWLKPPDQMDLWLAAQGYYRKHTARDGTCLFRAVSEQLFLTQAFHLEVRRCCIEFGLLHKCLFQKMTKSSIEDRLEKLRCPAESGGYLEINIISRMYKCDFILFQEVGKPPLYGTNNGYEKKITLCIAHERHYDSVYSKEHINNAAFCQSIIYESLYKDVFGLLEVDYAVKKMLRDKSSRYQRENSSCFLQHGMDMRLEMRDNCTNVKELLNLGITPFPYKVAKSLDPEIYRNVEYDTWNEYRKGLRFVKKVWNSHELGPGARCLVKLSEGKVFHAFIQEMEPSKGPVLVFIEELGEKRTVPFESLELIPVPAVQQQMPLKPVRLVQNIKPIVQQQQPDSIVSSGKKNFKNGKKACQGSEHKRQNGANIETNNDSNLTSVTVVSSSDYQQSHDDYRLHREIQDNYQNQAYVTQSCEVTSSVSEVEENTRVEPQQVQPACPPNTLPIYSVNGGSDVNNNYSSSSVQSYCAVNVLPNRSMLADGSDLPLTDISAVRYFYNLGLDYYVRMNCVMRPDVPTNGTCYPIIQSPAQYIPEPPHISYVNFAYEQSPQQLNHVSSQQMVTMPEGAAITAAPPAREPVPPSPGVISVTSETSSSSHSVSRQPVSSTSSHHVAPRFKNRRKINNSNSYNKSYGSTPKDSLSVNNSFRHNGKYQGASLVQQPDVSTMTTNPVSSVSPMFPVTVSHPPPPPPTSVPAHAPPPTVPSSAILPTSVPPPPAPLPQTNHYLPVQSSYTPPGIPQTYYFQPVECDSYCPVTVGGYIEYSVVEPPPPGMYPTVLSQPQTLTPYSPAPFVTSDGIYYQQIVPSNTV